MPPKVRIAIGRKDWRHRLSYPPIHVVHFSDELLGRCVESHHIAGTLVPVLGATKTVTDLFRYRHTVGDALAIEGLRIALRRRTSTPAVWPKMEPYLMALTRYALERPAPCPSPVCSTRTASIAGYSR